MIIICFLTFGFSANVASAQDRCFRIIDLGEIGSAAAASGPFGVNNAGVAVYTKRVGGNRHAFVNVLPPTIAPIGGGCHDLHDLSGLDAGGESVAHDVNDSDIAVGWATFNGEKHAVVWRIDLYDPEQPEGERIPRVDLGLLSVNSTYSEAFAINDDFPEPVIIGRGNVSENCACEAGGGNTTRGFWLKLSDPPEDLGDAAIHLHHSPCAGYPGTSAFDVSTGLGGPGPNTTAVGSGAFGGGGCGAAINQIGIYWDEPGQGPVLPGTDLNNGIYVSWFATGISDNGGIVGSVFDPGNDSAAYWPDINAAPVDIGSIVDGSGASYAKRINNRNPATEVIAAVGWNNDSIGGALLWECSGDCSDPEINWSFEILDQILSTNCTAWDLRRAYDVNDETRIIGWGRNTTDFPNTDHAVILVPVEFCCIADLDGDGTVSTSDLLILFANWGPCPTSLTHVCCADLNSDGTVNNEDLLILFANWGPCGGESAGSGGGSPSLQAAVQQMGFPSVAAHQAWLAQASEAECFLSTCVLITILQDQDDQGQDDQ